MFDPSKIEQISLKRKSQGNIRCFTPCIPFLSGPYARVYAGPLEVINNVRAPGNIHRFESMGRKRTHFRLMKDYLHFNRGERAGMVVLFLLLSAVIAANLVVPHLERTEEFDFSEFEMAVLEFEAVQASIRDSLERNRHKNAWQKTSREGWREAGQVGGTFRKKGRNAEKEIRFSQQHGTLNKEDRPGGPAGRQATQPPDSLLLIELNAADSLDLQQLRGIGPSFARRIVKYRLLLGGYANKEQLLEVYGMDSARYNLIADNLTLDTALILKIALDSATIKDLMRHPYIEFYVAKLLVSYRDAHGEPCSFRGLETDARIPAPILQRIRPYLRL